MRGVGAAWCTFVLISFSAGELMPRPLQQQSGAYVLTPENFEQHISMVIHNIYIVM
jgi:hypothetical protein